MPWAMAAALLAAVVALYTLWVHVNPTTVALTLLLLIQWLAATRGLGVAVATSLAAGLSFNYFFLPPVGTFTIGDTQNWVALAAFLATALIGSNLASRLHAARAASERRGRELELLYDFGQRLLTPGGSTELLRQLPFLIAASFQCLEVAIYLNEGGQLYASTLDFELPPALLHDASAASHPFAGPTPGSLLVPLAIGVRPVGSIYLGRSPEADPTGDRTLPTSGTLEAMSNLVALSLERAAAVEKLVHAEAGAESDRLRATLLDAVTHDLRTPLTSIKASVTGLLSQANLSAEQREELLTIIDEESDRLDRLIAQAVEMAQLDARAVRLDRRPTALAPLFEDVLADLGSRWPERILRFIGQQDIPNASVDPALVAKVLIHLVENGAKYTAARSPIEVTLEASGHWLQVAVRDQGPGIPAAEQVRIFDKFYRAPAHRYRCSGTGMGLAISRAIVEAHGGALTVQSTVAEGSRFCFTLPRA